MIRIELRTLAEGHTPFRFEESAEDLELGRFVEVHDPVAVSLDADRRGDQITVRGEARLRFGDACGRCGRTVEEELAAEILVFADRRGKDDPEDEAALEEEGSILYHDGMELPLDEIVREAIILEAPSVVLCRPDCAGLCPTCGADRNEGACGCPPPDRDPRWSVLESLRKDEQDPNE